MKRWNIFIWKHYLIKEKRFKDGIILKKNRLKKQNEKDTRRKNYLSSGSGIRCRESSKRYKKWIWTYQYNIYKSSLWKMLTERKIYKIKNWKRNNTYFLDGRISKRSKKKCEKRWRIKADVSKKQWNRRNIWRLEKLTKNMTDCIVEEKMV